MFQIHQLLQLKCGPSKRYFLNENKKIFPDLQVTNFKEAFTFKLMMIQNRSVSFKLKQVELLLPLNQIGFYISRRFLLPFFHQLFSERKIG
jgi:hypothetical protein